MMLTDGDRLVVVTCLKFCAVTEDQKSKIAMREYRMGDAAASGRFSHDCAKLAEVLSGPTVSVMLYDADRENILTALKICAMLHEKMAKAARDKCDPASMKKSALFSGECVRLIDLLENRPNRANGTTSPGTG